LDSHANSSGEHRKKQKFYISIFVKKGDVLRDITLAGRLQVLVRHFFDEAFQRSKFRMDQPQNTALDSPLEVESLSLPTSSRAARSLEDQQPDRRTTPTHASKSISIRRLFLINLFHASNR
jgi:hypothetical protein